VVTTVKITHSAGDSIHPVHGEDAGGLMKIADLALYDGKRAGRNAYRISDRTELSALRAASMTRPHPALHCQKRQKT
jgi:predicted signal transduction protein with EAL and GGDEF domain